MPPSLIYHCLSFSTAVSLAAAAGVAELISLLHQRGTFVFLVSGGFRAIIHPIAKSLGIPVERVYANTIRFKVCNHCAALVQSTWLPVD